MPDSRAVTVEPYAANLAQDWDGLVTKSVNGTFLHSRRFLSYHGDRFHDRSLMVRNAESKLIAVLPAAMHPSDPSVVVSHPGLTYGGLVHDGSLRGAGVLDVLSAVLEEYEAEGVSKLHYKAVPAMYHRTPAADDIYAMFRLDANRFRCDLSATIDLTRPRRPLRKDRRAALKRAARFNVSTSDSWEASAEFWPVLADNIARHGSVPTHSYEEITLLHDLFPDKISLVSAILDGEVVAGTVLFDTWPVLHSQYIGSIETGREASAVDLVISRAIDIAETKGFLAFDFGISTEQAGRYLNDPLHQFKASFGAGATLYEHYELSLDV